MDTECRSCGLEAGSTGVVSDELAVTSGEWEGTAADDVARRGEDRELSRDCSEEDAWGSLEDAEDSDFVVA